MYMTNKKINVSKRLIVAFKLVLSSAVLVLYLHYFLPQNWGYFVTKPSSVFYNVYRIDKGIAQSTPLINNNMNFGMGISRRGRLLYKTLIETIASSKNVVWKPLPKPQNSFLLPDSFDTIYIDKEKNFFTGPVLITSSVWPSDSTIQSKKPIQVVQQYILAFIVAK